MCGAISIDGTALSLARAREAFQRGGKKSEEGGRNRAGGGHCDIDSLSGQQKERKKRRKKQNLGIIKNRASVGQDPAGDHAGTIHEVVVTRFHVCIRCYDTFICKRLLTISSVYSRARDRGRTKSWLVDRLVPARIREKTPSGSLDGRGGRGDRGTRGEKTARVVVSKSIE